MSEIIESQSFWILLIIHLGLFLICTYFKLFKSIRVSRIHVAQISRNDNTESNNTATSLQSTLNIYHSFPKFSWSVVCKCIKLNHIALKTFLADYPLQDRNLDIMTGGIFLIGILGITGSEYKAWPSVNFFAAGIFAGLLARVFHSWYSTLQEKQKSIEKEFSSNNKLVRMVEAEVIRRLNIHRIMRRVLGYFIMILYYGANMYYCIQFIYAFDKQMNYYWAMAFGTAVIFEYGVLEVGIIVGKIEAINYLKVGGSELLETLCRVMINEDFLKTFN